jgi:flotillin
LRGVLAELTPEEVNQDKTRFAQNLMKQAEEDLLKLGLELDNLKIQNVTDDKGYLDSIGRISSADLQKKAIIGEAESKADATIKAAQAKLGIALSQVEKEMKVVKANAEKRIKVAQTNKIAMVNEVRSATGTEMARARADLNVQQARIIQVQKELEADLIQPAMAASEAAIQDAKAKAAKIIADGHASAEALREVTATWKAAGPYARDVFLMPKLQGIINTLVLNTIGDINISKISMVNGGGAQIVAPTADGDSKAVATVPPLPTKLHQFNEQMKATMGVDVSKILERTVGKKD